MNGALPMNGTITFSFIKWLDLNNTETANIQIYPNPANALAYCKGTGLSNGPAELTLVDQSGNTVYYKKIEIRDNQLNETIPVSSLPSSNYYLLLHSTGKWIMQN